MFQLVIDWDELTNDTTYTCADFTEGGLFALVQLPVGAGGGGGAPTSITEYTDDFTADGSEPVYIFSGGAGHTCTISAIADIVGDILIKNISAETLTVVQDDSLLIDGYSSVDLLTMGCIKVIPNNTKLNIIQGSLAVDYSETAP